MDEQTQAKTEEVQVSNVIDFRVVTRNKYYSFEYGSLSPEKRSHLMRVVSFNDTKYNEQHLTDAQIRKEG